MPNFESDYPEGTDDGDYGPLAGTPHPVKTRSAEEIRAAEYWRKKKEREQRTSSNFNSHMIHLYNSRSK